VRILIGIPSFGDVSWQFVLSLNHLIGHTIRTRPDISLVEDVDRRTYRHFARTAIAKTAVTREADALLFIDDDMTFEEDALLRLLAHDKPAVSALYFQRARPTGPVMYNKAGAQWTPILKYPNDTLIPVGGFGLGLALIKTDVFRQIPEPWFCQDQGAGEDMFFCRRCNEAGIPLHVDTGVQAGHLFEEKIAIGEAHYLRDRKEVESVD
jgi:hypothetical protein